MSFQRYTEYKDSGVTWLGKIPAHWSTIKSRRLFAQRKERALPDDKQLTASQKYGVIYQDDFMEIEGKSVVQVITGADILKHVEPNDFVISMRSFQGGIEWCGYRGSISSAYVMLIPSASIHVGFFSYLFKSIPYIQALQSTTNLVRDGQALRYGNFTQMDLPVVPYTEQETIASFLDIETGKINTLVVEQERLITLLKEKRQALISRAVTKGLNPAVQMKDSGIEWIKEIPKHWDIVPLKYTARLLTEKTSQRKFPVAMENIESWSGKFLETQGEYAGDGVAFKSGDILFGKLRPYLAKAWLADRSGEAIGDFHVIRPIKDYINGQFIQYVFLNDSFISIVNGSTYGAKMPRVSWSFMGLMHIPIPPLSEQEDISSFLDRETNKIDALISEAERAINLLKERRTALIAFAVTGKIDVRGVNEKVIA